MTLADGVDTSARAFAPAPDEIEVTILGPGRGESILVHTGNGNWAIIDTFRGGAYLGQTNSVPAPVRYLEHIGVDPAEGVKAVIITHPHHDHYDGIRALMNRCRPNGIKGPCLYMSGALDAGRWIKFLNRLDPEEAETRFAGQLCTAIAEADANGMLRLLGYPGEIMVGGLRGLTVLAPTTRARTDQWAYETQRLANSPNFMSVVLWLEIGQARALLCADLDNHREYGWHAVIRETHEADRFEGAGLVKVPHHGSRGAHSVDLYQTFASDFHALLTPNWNGQLPDEEVIDDLKLRSTSVHLVGAATPLSEESTRSNLELGWVTARHPLNGTGSWDVIPFGRVESHGGAP